MEEKESQNILNERKTAWYTQRLFWFFEVMERKDRKQSLPIDLREVKAGEKLGDKIDKHLHRYFEIFQKK